MRSLASAECSLNGAPAGLAVLAKRLPSHAADVDGVDAELLVVRGLLKLYAAETRAGADDLRAAIHLSREGFSHQHLPAAHVYLARALFILGEWDEALVHARAARASVADGRHDWLRGRVDFVFGTVAAARGMGRRAGRTGSGGTGATGAADATWAEMLARILKSAICRARADPAGVIAALRPLATDTRIVVSQMAMIAWWPILIEGLIEAGETGDATAELDRLARHVDDTGMAIGGRWPACGRGWPLRKATPMTPLGCSTSRYERSGRTTDDRSRAVGILRSPAHARGNRRDATTICGRRMSCSVVSAPSRIGKPSPMTLLRVESGRRKAITVGLDRTRAGRGAVGTQGHDQQ